MLLDWSFSSVAVDCIWIELREKEEEAEFIFEEDELEGDEDVVGKL